MARPIAELSRSYPLAGTFTRTDDGKEQGRLHGMNEKRGCTGYPVVERARRVVVPKRPCVLRPAYDRQSHVGRLDRALDEAGRRGWTVVDMRLDWNAIFPPSPKGAR